MGLRVRESKRRRLIRRVALGVLVVWAAFWFLFAAGHLVSAPSLATLTRVLSFGGPILAIAVVSFFRIRLGGLLLLVHAAYSAWAFGSLEYWATLAFMTLPAVAVGLTLLVVGGKGLRG